MIMSDKFRFAVMIILSGLLGSFCYYLWTVPG